jgi:hypothetical protein
MAVDAGLAAVGHRLHESANLADRSLSPSRQDWYYPHEKTSRGAISPRFFPGPWLASDKRFS